MSTKKDIEKPEIDSRMKDTPAIISPHEIRKFTNSFTHNNRKYNNNFNSRSFTLILVKFVSDRLIHR